MITIRPVQRALVPVGSDAAARLSAPNYDEFQDDVEVWRAIRESPESVLRVTMSHCDVPEAAGLLEEGSAEALAKAAGNMRATIASPLTRTVERVLFIYEMVDPRRPGSRQIGLGGMAPTADIRTERTPEGPIIRNEGVREPKARGRARLIEATAAIVGTVNNAVADAHGTLSRHLERMADAREPAYAVGGGNEVRHRIWLVREPGEIARLQRVLADEAEAYVADGNHRSAAAAMLGQESFLTVFFTADRMNIAPYNRLVRLDALPGEEELIALLDRAFEIGDPPAPGPFQPDRTHALGAYALSTGWLHLTPRGGTFDPEDAAASIDHDIAQRHIFRPLGIEDAADERLAFVGANRDAAWLQAEVDAGRAAMAVTLPPVTMAQFIEVCRQRRMMPPKSTWFEPKIRSGLVMALLDSSGVTARAPR